MDALQTLLDQAPVLNIRKSSRLVILSDLHMGSGGRNDDFLKNAELFRQALENHYLPRGYTLVLNGDIEELLRSKREDILRAWPGIYRIFAAFSQANRLYRLVGNHEIVPGAPQQDPPPGLEMIDALRLVYRQESILIFHGHQAGQANSGRYNRILGWLLRVFANSLGIGNHSVSHSSHKKFKLEKKVYEFSRREKIISIIGHTHRPLFESLSREEEFAFHMEQLCREYAQANAADRMQIQQTIKHLKTAFYHRSHRHQRHVANLVYGKLLVPCLFNPGCGIGKRGITALEIKDGAMALVFWSNVNRDKRYLEYNEYKSPRLMADGSYRIILRRESLDYIFSRVTLLS